MKVLPTTGALFAAALMSVAPPMTQPLVAMQPPAVVQQSLPFVTLAKNPVKPKPEAEASVDEVSSKIRQYQAAFPAKPGDPVVLVSGSDKGADARLLDTEGQFGIVKLASGAIKAVDYDALVKGVK